MALLHAAERLCFRSVRSALGAAVLMSSADDCVWLSLCSRSHAACCNADPDIPAGGGWQLVSMTHGHPARSDAGASCMSVSDATASILCTSHKLVFIRQCPVSQHSANQSNSSNMKRGARTGRQITTPPPQLVQKLQPWQLGTLTHAVNMLIAILLHRLKRSTSDAAVDMHGA